MDGKHIALSDPHGSASKFHNHKGFYSLVLMAIVCYNYKSVYVDVGCQYKGGVFRNTKFCKALENVQLGDIEVEEAGDGACSLITYCMKPYSHRNLPDEQILLESFSKWFWNISQSISFAFISLSLISKKMQNGRF